MLRTFKFFYSSQRFFLLNIFFFFKKFFGFSYFFFKFLCLFSGISFFLSKSLGNFSIFVKRCINSCAYFYTYNFVNSFKSNVLSLQANINNLKILRTFLKRNFLPCNGQRTKTNAQTCKKKRKRV